jgi:crotonobetainyl-CoA:carnitine CoA-transferase CaiB-like acyl-CoA transferase
MERNQSLPLEGFKVVELATVVAAPAGGRVLAAFGADVIKIEPPGGDFMRNQGANHSTPTDDYANPCFTIQNSGKKYVSLNLKTKAGYEAFHKLIAEADVFLTNVRPQSLEGLRLDYENLKKQYPRLVYAHLSGFGHYGPAKDRPGFDVCAFWLRGGAMLDWQTADSFPLRPTFGFGDMGTSANLVSGILMALLGRERTGHGTMVTTSLYGNGIWFNAMALVAAQPQYGKKFQPSEFDALDPFSQYYLCADGHWVGIFCNEYRMDKEKFARFFGVEHIIDDPRYASTAIMRENGMMKALITEMNEIFKKKTSDEWCELLMKADIAHEKLLHFSDIYKDEQAWANNYLEEVSFGDGLRTAMPLPPITFSEYGIKGNEPSGRIGENTDEVLKNVGYTEVELETMRREKAIL